MDELEKRIAALEVEVQRLRMAKKETFLICVLGIAIADLILNPFATLLIGLLQK
ncbi:hypothetical protein [Caproiciproducens galactitolivorans]|uniref:Uncharacterized protein n=1 Tax=Caproiciproducens galactitolivorans TaxID=642589 RepID=A0ABT4BWP4_9FIRM|nr:hypothetical protein [Caproiciproducens galactitolivorans]MCY1715314.1 hypothetical protein [Caproiciproducens galactitolivorans]